MASEYFTGNRSQLNYGKEDEYGTITSVDGYPGLLMGFDPTKNDLGYIEIYGLDGGTKDVNQHIETTQRYGGTMRIRPQHGVMFAYAYDSVDNTNFSDTAKFHSLGDLTDENFDLNSMSIETYKVHSTTGDSHKEIYKGVKFNTLELTVDKGTPLCEINIDFDAQSLAQSNAGPSAFETTLTNLKKYNANTVSPFLRPYMWKDLFVEIHDPATATNSVVTDVVSCRVKVDNELLVDYTADATLSGQISEPVPQRRKHEIELTVRMDDSTYFDFWKDLTELESINPTYSGSSVCEAFGGVNDTITSIDIDDGAGSELTSIPSLGILGVDNDADGVANEFMAFYDVENTGTGHILQVGRGLFGSSGVTVADDDPCAIFGNITVALNKGSNAINSTGSGTQGLNIDATTSDILVFTGWDCRVTTFGSPIDIGQGVVESTFLIRPAHLVPWTMDSITEGYFDTS